MNKKIVKPIALILVAALLMSFSLAYFTDRAETQANGTAGTVAISLANNINLLDANGQDIINPGDKRTAGLVVTNEGNKSIDVRTTVALTAVDYNGDPINFTGDADNQSEYDLYLASDVELVEGKGYAPKTGAKPLQVKSINGNVIKYVLPEYSLNGNSDKYPEVETIAGVAEFSHTHDLVMVMKGGADNAWQGSSMRIDVLVEAKQHENTAAGWQIVAQENVTHGSINQDAVLAEDVLTNENGTANGTITFSLRKQDGGNVSGIPNVTMKLVKLPENTLSAVDTLGGTVLGTVRSDSNGEGKFMGLEEGKYALVSPNFILTAEAENLKIVGEDGTDHYDYLGLIDWAATIEGTIKDDQGTGVPDVEVSIVDNNKEFVAGSTTDENGDYTIYPVVEGTYEIEVEDNDIVSGDNTVTVTEGNTSAAGDIVVEPAPVVPDEPVTCEHTYDKYVSNDDGTHKVLCSKCDNVSNASEACTYVDGACSKCGYSESVSDPIVATFTDGGELTWKELKLAENGTKYSYDTSVITDDSIGDIAFLNCTTLKTIEIPSSVKTIGYHAFQNCENLSSATIGNSVESIGFEAFYNCTSLTSIEIPNSVTSIGYGVFNLCTNLVSATLPNNLETIPNTMFYRCLSLESIEIPSSVKTIGAGSFNYCQKLTTVIIPDSVESLGNNAFDNCAMLTSITIGSGMKDIGQRVFEYCRVLSDITYNGTKTDWSNVTKGYNWVSSSFSYSCTIHCTDSCLDKNGNTTTCELHP